MSWERIAENRIRDAMQAGEFDNLPGAGKPLPNLTDGYDPEWWLKQLVQREQISVLPPSLEVLRKVESEMAAIWLLADEAKVRSRLLALNREIAKVNARATEGPPTRRLTASRRAGRASRSRRERMQHVDRPSQVQALPHPSRDSSARMDLKPLRGVLRPQRPHRVGRQDRRRRHVGQDPTIRPSELERAVGHGLDLIALFVNRAVMAAAQ